MGAILRRNRGEKVNKDLSFMDDYSDDEISFHKRKQNGEVTLEIFAIRTKPEGDLVKRKCEYGHEHEVRSEIRREVVAVYLDEVDVKKLLKFINDKEWCK
jgi:hypothetical protein